jgi:hypothetical protein
MPFFKSTHNILKAPWEDEVFDKNWMDSDKLILPSKKDWDYKKPLQIENVNIWEVIFERGGGWGLYASWDPYAEFYLLNMGPQGMETYYGAGVQKHLKKRLKELGLSVPNNEVWVEPEDMWLYQTPEPKSNTLILL